MSNVKLLYNIIVGLLFSALWLLIGIIFYINSLSALSNSNFGMEYLIHFLWGIPFLAVIFGVIFIKKLGYKITLISFFIGTIFFTLIIPAL